MEVAYLVKEGHARVLVAHAIKDVGARPCPVEYQDLRSPTASFVWQALVHDFYPYWEEAVGFIRELRKSHPAIPVLLYLPVAPQLEELAAVAGEFPCIAIKAQYSDSAEPRRLRRAISHLLANVPKQLVVVLFAHLTNGSSPLAERFVSLAFDRVRCRNKLGPTTIRSLAAKLGVASRTLQRVLLEQGMPPPKQTLDWVTLLSITFEAFRFGSTSTAVAKGIQLDCNSLYRLRKRLLGEHRRDFRMSAKKEFDGAFLAFAERCAVPRELAEDVLTVHAAWGVNRQMRAQQAESHPGPTTPPRPSPMRR